MADVAGSTAIGEQLGPERSKLLMDEIVRLIAEEVHRFGGTVAQLAGDGLFALFGAPAAHEDDSERAVRAALAARDALGEYTRQLAEAYGVAVSARFGVNTGPVVLGDETAPAEERYNALGDTVNVAARLQTLAGEDDVAVGPATARQVEARFELDSLGEVELKGKSAPLEAFRVVGERRAGALPRATTPFVGRETEQAALHSALADLAEGRGAVVSITGEPGIGKSRLVAEAQARFAEDVRFLAGHGAAYAESFAYWPMRDLLRDWLELGISSPEAHARLELKAALARLDGLAETAYPFLATLLGIVLEPDVATQIGELSRDSVQRQTFEAVHGFVSALARERSLCLVMEDLHWADEATLELLEALLPVTDEEAVVLLLLYRNERDHRSWQLGQLARQRYPHRYRELELGPLDRDEALAIAEAELPERVADLLVDRAGGNPLFLEEALRDLVERGALRRENGRYELAVGVDELQVPVLVQEALQARLDRLSPETKEVVAVASVIGRSFDLPLLEQVSPAQQLRPSLAELQRLELVVEERRRPAPEYRFRHGLVQEAAYAGLTQTRRRSLHRSVGEALEQLAEEEAPEAYAVLGRHFAEGDEPQRAARYLVKAGDVARGLDAEEEALGHYRRALEFLDRTGDGRLARDTLLKIALTHHLAFDFEQADHAYEEAFARRLPDPPQVELTEDLRASTYDLDSLVPGYSYWAPAWEFVPNLFRGLLQADRDDNVVPALAEDLRVSPDGTTYRLRLRRDARWSDGEPVTADDFVYAWNTMRSESLPVAQLLGSIDEAVARDAWTLELSLARPMEYLPHLLTIPPSYPWPRHRCEELGDGWREPANLIGNGPFVLADVEDTEAYHLRASSSWTLPRGNVKAVEYLRISGEDMHERWLAGEFDLGRSFRNVPPASVLESPQTIMDETAGLATWHVAFNVDAPPFDDVLVRKAFSHASDRTRLHTDVRSLAEPAERGGVIPPPMPAHSHRAGLPHDPELARKLLAEAGHPGGQGLPELIVYARAATTGEALARQWRETLGARTRVVEMDEGAPTRIDAHAITDGWLADYPSPGNFFRGLRAGSPIPLYTDERERALLDEAQSLRDRRAKIRVYNEVERLWITEQAALVPLEYMRHAALRRPWLEGYWLGYLGASLDQVSIRRPAAGAV